MISFVKGTVDSLTMDRAIIDNSGIGYSVFMPSSHISTIGIGDEVKIYTYLNVREDAMQLYGFIDLDSLDLFKLLITVNGIGPKGALAVLSTLGTEDFKVAVLSSDSKAISKAPGVGAKTAQRVIIELKDKLSLEDLMTVNNEASKDNIDNDKNNEAVMALVSLGYSQSDAFKTVKSLGDTSKMDVETIIKNALKRFY